MDNFIKSKKGDQDPESIQSITTSDPGYQAFIFLH